MKLILHRGRFSLIQAPDGRKFWVPHHRILLIIGDRVILEDVVVTALG